MKELTNKTLAVKIESINPERTVFENGDSHIELTGVDVDSDRKEWHHVMISEENWRMITPHAHIGCIIKFTGTVRIPGPGENHYYRHTMSSGHAYDIGTMSKDCVPTGFVAAPKIESDCPWAKDSREGVTKWEDLPVRKATTKKPATNGGPAR